MSNIKKITVTAVSIALCVVLPMAFHGIQNAGQVFLPMHIPVLLCGLICGPQYGLLCGLSGPALSMLLTGMPPAAILPSMMVELAVYGLVTGLVMSFVHTGKLYADVYVALILAMIAGRVVAGVCKALIFSRGAYSMNAWVASSFVTALPGIAIQLLIIPAVVFALMKAHVVPERAHKGKLA